MNINEANIGTAILQNYERAESILETSQNSAGSALAENEKYLQSIQGYLDKFQATWESFSIDFLDSDAVKIFIDALSGILKMLDGIASASGGLVGILATPALLALSKNNKGAVRTYDKYVGTNFDEKTGKGNVVTESRTGTIFNALKEEHKTKQAERAANLKQDIEQAKRAAQAYKDLEDKKISQKKANRIVNQAIKNSTESGQQLIKSLNKSGTAYQENIDIINKHNNVQAQAIAAEDKLSTGIKRTAKERIAGLGKSIASRAGMVGGNIAAGLAIGAAMTAIEKVASTIDSKFLISKQAKTDAMAKVVGDYSKANQTFSDNTATIKSLQAEFTSLSKGVSENGANISLSADEYARYNEIVSELISMNPSLVKGYTAQGNAIIDNNKAISDSIKYQQELKDKAIKDYTSTNSLKGIIAGVSVDQKETVKSLNSARDQIVKSLGGTVASGTGKDVVGTDIGAYSKEINKALGKNVDLEHASVEELTQVADKRALIMKYAEESGKYDKEALNNLKSGLNDLSSYSMDYQANTQPIVENLNTWASSVESQLNESGKSLMSTVPAALQSGFQAGIKEIAGMDLSAGGMQTAVQDLAGQLTDLYNGATVSGITAVYKQGTETFKKYGDMFDTNGDKAISYQEVVSQVAQAQETFNNSARDTSAVEEYNNAIEGEVAILEHLAGKFEEAGNDVLAQSLRAQAASINSFAKDNILDLQEAFNPLSGLIESATNAKAEFDQAMAGGDYNTAIDGYKEIFDSISEDFGTGRNSKAFWQAAEQMLGRDTIKELGGDYDKVAKKMKGLKDTADSTRDASANFFKELADNRDKLNKIDGVKIAEDGSFDIDADKYDEVADVLDRSSEYLMAMVESARQWTNVDLSDTGAVEKTIKDMDTTMQDADGTSYQLWNNISQQAQAAGLDIGEVYNKLGELEDSGEFKFIDLQSDSVDKTLQSLSKINTQLGENQNGKYVADANEVIASLQLMGATADETAQFLEKADKAGQIKEGSGKKEGQTWADYASQAYAVASGDPMANMANSMEKVVYLAEMIAVAMGAIPSDLTFNSNLDDLTKQVDKYNKDVKDGNKEAIKGKRQSLHDQIKQEYDYYKQLAQIAKKNGNKAGREEAEARMQELKKLDAKLKPQSQKAQDSKSGKGDKGKGGATQEGGQSGGSTIGSNSNVVGKDKPDHSSESTKSKSSENRYQAAVRINTEYTGGKSLEEINKEIKQLPPETQVQVTADIANAHDNLEVVDGELMDVTSEEYQAKVVAAADTSKIPSEIQQTTEGVEAETPIEADTSQIKGEIQAAASEAHAKTTISATVNEKQGKKVSNKGGSKTVKVNYTSGKVPVPKMSPLTRKINYKGGPIPKPSLPTLIQKVKRVITGGGSEASGTANRRRPNLASGTNNRRRYGSAANGRGGRLGPRGRGGLTLTGELGPELIWLPDEDISYLTGVNGPEMQDLPKNAVVWPYSETKRIMGNTLAPGQLNNLRGMGLSGLRKYENGEYDEDEFGSLAKGNAGGSVFGSMSNAPAVSSSSSSTGSKGKSSGGNDGKKKKKKKKKKKIPKYKATEIVDWVEVRLDRLERKVKSFTNTANSEFESYTDRIDAFNKAIAATTNQLDKKDGLKAAYKKYYAKADSYAKNKKYTDSNVDKKHKVGQRILTRDMITKIQNGSIDIKKYSKTQQEAIKQYQEWYEKGLKAEEDYYAALKARAELYADRLEATTEQIKNGIEHIVDSTVINPNQFNKFYDQLAEINNVADWSDDFKDKKADEAIKNLVDAYSDAWDIANDLMDYNLEFNITTPEKNYKEMQNNLANLVNYYNSIKNNLDEEQRNTFERFIRDAKKDVKGALEDLNSKLQETAGQLDDIFDIVERLVRQEREDMKDALNKQLDSYNKIIDDKKKALQLTKQQADYEDSLKDSAKEESKLRKQIASLSLDDSRAAQAKRAELEEQLNDLLEERNRTVRDETLSRTEDALDEQADKVAEFFEALTTKIDEFLENQSAVNEVVYQYIDAFNSGADNGKLLESLYDYNAKYGDGLIQTVDDWKADLIDVNNAVKDKQLETIEEVRAYLLNSDYFTEHSSVDESGNVTSTYKNEHLFTAEDRDVVRQYVASMQTLQDKYYKEEVVLETFVQDMTKLIDEIGQLLNGQIPEKHHTGLAKGFTGSGANLKQHEVLRILTDDELVLNRTDQMRLANQMQTLEALKGSVGQLVSSGNSVVNSNNTNTIQLTVNAPVTIEGSATPDIANQLNNIGDNIADKTLDKLTNALRLNGVR